MTTSERRRMAAVGSAVALFITAGAGHADASILDNCDSQGNCTSPVQGSSTKTKTETKTIPGSPGSAGSEGAGGGSGKRGGSGGSGNASGAGLSEGSGGGANPLTGSSSGSSAKPAAKAKPLTAAQKAAILNNNWREESLGDRNLGGCGDPDFPGVAAPCAEPEPAAEAEPAVQAQPASSGRSGTPGTPARTVTTVTVDEVVDRAKAKIKLPKPNIGSAPCTEANCKGTVGVPTWFWLDGDEWQTRTDTASAGGNTVRVTAKPSKVVWKLGDGQSVTCTGPGTKYSEDKGWATSPDCGLKDGYKKAGKYSVTADITYDVTVTGDANESETVTRSSSEPLTVREIQTVIK